MFFKKIKKNGFTLIELLIVIAIIGVLSSILYVAINPREKIKLAEATKIAQDLKTIESGFRNRILEGKYELYPKENSSANFGTNPTIVDLITVGEIVGVSPSVKATGLGDEVYRYDNDGDYYPYTNNCPNNPSPNSRGVNI